MPDTQPAFLQGSLLRHITVMTMTSSLGIMAIFLVDLVDMVFISMLGKEELAAAVGYAGAILFFTTSFGLGMSIAAGTLVARALGAGDSDKARHYATSTMVWGALSGAIFAAIVWVNLEPFSRLIGASGPTLELSVMYLSILIPTLPVLLVGIVGMAILRSHGSAKQSMMVTLIGGVLNAIIDPILIFGLDMQLAGAAWASVIARFAIAGTALYCIFRYHGGLNVPRLSALAPDLRPIFSLAFPAILTQLATPIGQAYVTRSMAAYGEEAVSGMAIVARITPVAFGSIFALSGAIGPIIGQNAGAGNSARVRVAYRDAMIFTAAVVLISTALLFLLRSPIAALFQAEGLARQLIFLFCGPLALAFFFNGVIFTSNAAMNNLGHPFYSTWVNWGRHTLGTIPFVLAFSAWMGAPGVLIGQAAGAPSLPRSPIILVSRSSTGPKSRRQSRCSRMNIMAN